MGWAISKAYSALTSKSEQRQGDWGSKNASGAKQPTGQATKEPTGATKNEKMPAPDNSGGKEASLDVKAV